MPLPIRPVVRAVLLATAVALLLARPAAAVIGGEIDANQPGSAWAGVGSVVRDGRAFSGVLIAPGYVLTAAHVVAGAAPARLAFRLNPIDGQALVLGVAEVHVHPGYAGFRPGRDRTVHEDLALLRLAVEAPSWIPAYALYRGPLLPRMVLTLVGYGAAREADGEPVAASATVKRVGRAVLAGLLPDDDGAGHAEVFVFRYSEQAAEVLGVATLAGGDSGGPVFVRSADGRPYLAGISTFVFSGPGGAGGGGGMIAAAYQDWIATHVPGLP